MTDLIELRMNVAALKRVDPYVKDILETATHVALYTFNPESYEWAKTDIEGALFVYSRNGEPYNGILIMNRLNTNNLVEPVTHGLELQLHEPFLLYRNSRSNIYGIWFYEKEECIRIATFMSKLLQESEEKNTDRSPLKVKKNYGLHGNNVDIFSMLSKAQENFNTNKEIKKKNIKESLSPLHSTMIENINSGPLTAPLGPDVTSQSVMDFFAKAKVNTRQYKSDQPTPGNVSINETKPLLARLMSHSSAHTLEHIEKQQRSITPQPSTQPLAGNSILGNNVMSAASNKSKRRSKVISQQDSILPSTAPLPQDIQPSLIHPVNDTNGTAGFLRIQSPTATTAPSEFKNNQSKSNANNPLASLFAKASSTSEDVAGGGPTLSGTKSAPALIPPTMFAAPTQPEPLNRPLEPLTRNQLLQAFNYLLNSDPDFINKLHEAYVKSFGEILS